MAYLKKYNSLIKAIINIFSDNLIGIAISGSRSLSYISNPRDTELVIFLKENIKNIPYEFISIKKEYQKQNISLMINNFKFWQEIPAFIYLEHFYKMLYGKNKLTYNILENKKDYYNALKYWVLNKYGITVKYFYHILTGIYILENNSYNFTEEQVNNINILHDAIDKEACNKLINWMYNDYFKLGD